MALGDFINAKPTTLQALKADLQAIEARLLLLEGRAGFHFVSADPAPALGIDGDAALDTSTGYIWRKNAGSWTNTLLSVWKD